MSLLIKNYDAFFKFSIAPCIFFFFLASFWNSSALEFAKGFSTSLLLVSIFFEVKNERNTKTS